MSKSSNATAPTKLQAKSAWARGPQQSATAPSPRSQSPSPFTPVNQTHSRPAKSAWSKGPPQPATATSTPTNRTHSRRPSTIGGGVPIKDGVSIPRKNAGSVKQGSGVTFGSIDDTSESIALSPAVAPSIESEGVKYFGSVPATGHITDGASMLSRTPLLPAQVTSSSSSPPTPVVSMLAPTASAPLKTKIDIGKMFRPPFSEPSPNPPSDTSSPSVRSPTLPWLQQPQQGQSSYPPLHQLGLYGCIPFRGSMRQQEGGGRNGGLPRLPQTSREQLEDTKNELQKTRGLLAEAQAQLEPYARELKRARAEIWSMDNLINGLERECQRYEEATQSHENELSIVRKELQDAKNLALTGKELVGDQSLVTHPNNGLEHECQRLKETIQVRENELSVVRRELEDANNLAAIRGKWLQGAEIFLTKADTLSVSEVVEKVANLNEEIFQAAALLGEDMVHSPHDVSQEEMDSALGIAQEMIGSKLTDIPHEQLRKDVPEVNPLITQVVLQVFLVGHCSYLVRSWSEDPTCATNLAAIYSRIRDKEEQTVSGRWRALTRNHSRPTSDGWEVDLLQNLDHILRVASWVTPSVQELDAFKQKLKPIFRAVEDLRDALGENITSADFEISVMEADQVFQPAIMEDAYGDLNGEHAPQEVVVGTTGIGLMGVMPNRSAKGELLYENVVSAKVVLESTLLEVLQPPPPRTSRRKGLT